METLAHTGVDAGQFAGIVALKSVGAARNRTVSLDYALVKEHQGKELGTEVIKFLLQHSFNHLGLHRVQLEIKACHENTIVQYEQMCAKMQYWCESGY